MIASLYSLVKENWQDKRKKGGNETFVYVCLIEYKCFGNDDMIICCYTKNTLCKIEEKNMQIALTLS